MYKIINLIPLAFGNRGTVEFRCHTSTFNKDKIINWIFICNAICKFAFNNRAIISREGTNVSLDGIINDSYSGELSNYLLSYINYRKQLMLDHSKKGDNIGDLDITHDNLNSWKYHLKSLI